MSIVKPRIYDFRKKPRADWNKEVTPKALWALIGSMDVWPRDRFIIKGGKHGVVVEMLGDAHWRISTSSDALIAPDPRYASIEKKTKKP